MQAMINHYAYDYYYDSELFSHFLCSFLTVNLNILNISKCTTRKTRATRK